MTHTDTKIMRKKCDVQTRPHDKTKPNVCKTMTAIIVQRHFWRFSPDLPENRYRIVSKIVAKSVMILIIVHPSYRRCGCPTACRRSRVSRGCGLVCNGNWAKNNMDSRLRGNDKKRKGNDKKGADVDICRPQIITDVVVKLYGVR